MPIDWDNEGAGHVLILPSPPWIRHPKDPPPMPRWRPTGPPLERESTKPIADLTAQLTVAMLDTMPEDVRLAAQAAYAASIDAGGRLNNAQRELAALSGPAPKGVTVDQRSERHMRRIGLEGYIADLLIDNERINQACTVALAAARDHVSYYSGRQIHTDARAKARAMREEADRLIEEAGRLEIALQNAIGKVNAWLPTDQSAGPVIPAPAVESPAVPRRKRLF